MTKRGVNASSDRQISITDGMIEAGERARRDIRPGRAHYLYNAAVRASKLMERSVLASDENPESVPALGRAVGAINLYDRIEGKLVTSIRDAAYFHGAYDVACAGRDRILGGLSGTTLEDASPHSTHHTALKPKSVGDVIIADMAHGHDSERLSRLLPEMRRKSTDIILKKIDQGTLPEELRERLVLLDHVGMVAISTYGNRLEQDVIILGKQSDYDLTIEIDASLGRSDGEIWKTYFHEILHLLNGRLINVNSFKRGHSSLIESGIGAKNAPFSTRWMNEAMTEHIALCLSGENSDMLLAEFNVETDPLKGGSYSYINERGALATIIELADVSLKDMVWAYFEDGAGAKKDYRWRQSGFIMSKINAAFEPGVLGGVNRALRANYSYGSLNQINRMLKAGVRTQQHA